MNCNGKSVYFAGNISRKNYLAIDGNFESKRLAKGLVAYNPQWC